MKLENKKLEINKGQDIKITLNVRSYEQKALLGFISVAVEIEGKFSHAFNDLRVVSNKDGEIFIKEPAKTYTTKDNETKESPFFIMKKALKDDLVKILNENFN